MINLKIKLYFSSKFNSSLVLQNYLKNYNVDSIWRAGPMFTFTDWPVWDCLDHLNTVLIRAIRG